METKLRNMTEGSAAGHIFFLALPLMFGNVFQQMYTLCDAVIVGRGCGVEALAAVGAADWINWLILGIIQGFAQGFSIVFAQKFGAGNMKELRKSIGNGVVSAFLIGLFITIVSLCMAKPALLLMNTPREIIKDALAYLLIIYGGSLIVMAYNFAASMLRSLGDGKTPLIAMVIASVINIVLDLVFVLYFHMGVKGAALATVMAQFFSFVFCFFRILGVPELKLSRQDFKVDMPLSLNMLKVGTPVALQNGIIGLGGIVVQFVVNGYGVSTVAGITASNKLYGILEIAAIAFGYALSSYMGQNLGAKKYERIKHGMTTGAIMSVLVSVIITAVVVIFGREIVSLFISENAENRIEVVGIAYDFLKTMGWCLSILYLLHVYRSALQGLGFTVFAMLSGIAELIMRVSTVLILPHFIGVWGIYMAEIFAWVGADVILISSYYLKQHKLKSELIES